MAQFLRFTLLVILALVGFGAGVCGTLGLVMSAVEGTRGTDNYFGIVVIVSLIGVALAALCFLGVRALARSLRRHSAPVVASPDEP